VRSLWRPPVEVLLDAWTQERSAVLATILILLLIGAILVIVGPLARVFRLSAAAPAAKAAATSGRP
jgi:hypothetical protein